MDILTIILIVSGLTLFETVSSIDNAIINAEVLTTMSQKAKRWFLVWGMFIAVFLVRGLLPFLIIWATSPSLGSSGVVTATFSNDPHVTEAVERSAPVLLMGGGVFLLFLFFHWLFLETKNYGLKGERLVEKYGVLGAFAFTLSVPLILLGNGLGAIVVRQLTISNIERVKRYIYLKNGAMYSILALGTIMVLEGFGFHIPPWLSPIVTALAVGYFFLKSHKTLALAG